MDVLRYVAEAYKRNEPQWQIEEALSRMVARTVEVSEQQTNCGSTHDTIDFIAKGEKLVLCQDCRSKLATGQQVVAVKQIGRPSLGVTKKVSLTLPQNVWDYLDEESKGNRSEYLRKLIDNAMWSQGDWSNNACQGYAVIAAKELGYSDDDIQKLVRAMYRSFDEKTIEDARAEYEKSPY